MSDQSSQHPLGSPHNPMEPSTETPVVITCLLTENCIGEPGHEGECVIDGEASILPTGDLTPQTTVRNTFKPDEFKPRVIEPKGLHSRDMKNPVAIPDEGLTFTVIYGPEGEEIEQSIRLHQALAGLNMQVNAGNNQSQAQTFASFAVQAGFTDEREMLDDPDLEPYLRLQSDRDGKVYCKANNAIDVLEIRSERLNNAKARDTMNADGRPFTQPQEDEALRLVTLCKDEGLFDLRNDLLTWLQKPNKGRGFAGDLSYSMGEVNIFLDRIYPDRKKERKARRKAARVSQQGGNVQTSQTSTQVQSGPRF